MCRLRRRIAEACRGTRDAVEFAGALAVITLLAMALGAASLRRLDIAPGGPRGAGSGPQRPTGGRHHTDSHTYEGEPW